MKSAARSFGKQIDDLLSKGWRTYYLRSATRTFTSVLRKPLLW